MRDKLRQSTTFRHVHQRQINFVAKEQNPGLISSGTLRLDTLDTSSV